LENQLIGGEPMGWPPFWFQCGRTRITWQL